MENININKILNRENTVATIRDILKEFELNTTIFKVITGTLFLNCF